ncbi:MAG: sulfatase-like hydrolase/transferase [Bacteroidota bacterium]|nr:sulfatase-like hydrolase/transferase [Bacteroidota bacterium]
MLLIRSRVAVRLLSVMLAGLCWTVQTAAQPVLPPNIVLIIGDDHGYPYFGFTGSAHVHTPHLDRLASAGALFTLGHTTDNHCRPALQSLVTGLYPVQFAALADSIRRRDAALSPEYAALAAPERERWDYMHQAQVMREFTTLPGLLSEAGYMSFQAGKWWEQSFANGGFTEGMSQGWAEEVWGQPGFFRELMGGDGIALARETMQPVYDFIDRHIETPFFLWYGPSLPHTPLSPPEEYARLYADTGLSESAKQYYGNCTWFDAGVGELLAHLDSRGLADRTLVIYVNDNGWEQPPFAEYAGDHILYSNGGPHGKLSIHDQAFRTPIVLYWPQEIAPQTFPDVLVSSTDLVPTILDFAGLAVPEYMPGKSLRPLMEGAADWDREAIIGRVTQLRSETDVMGHAQEGHYVRTRRWHFTLTGGQARLYDMLGDPYTDVAERYLELLPEFEAQIEAWRQELSTDLPQSAVPRLNR